MNGTIEGTIAFKTTDDVLTASMCTGSAMGDGASGLHITVVKDTFPTGVDALLAFQAQYSGDNVNFVDVGEPLKVRESDPGAVVSDLLSPGALWFRFVVTLSAELGTDVIVRLFATALPPARARVVRGEPLVFGLLGRRPPASVP